MPSQEDALSAPLKGSVSYKGGFRIFLVQTVKLLGEQSLDHEQASPACP